MPQSLAIASLEFRKNPADSAERFDSLLADALDPLMDD